MIDAEIIKSHHDCRAVIQGDLGKPHTSSANYDVYRCPLHHEVKGYSFVVYPDHWQCYGKCDKTGDVIAWVMAYHDMNFKQACNYLSQGIRFQPRLPARPQAPPEAPSEPPSEEWRHVVGGILHQAEIALWSKTGERAMAYLRGRGLSPDTIKRAGLGYIPGDMKTWYSFQADGHAHKYPSGITIPWYADDDLWGVNVRRPSPPGETKYHQFQGGHTKGSLYWSDDICPSLPVMFVEGEFDCLVAWQIGWDMVSPVTLGGNTQNLNSRWFKLLVGSPRILAATDNDIAGDNAHHRLAGLSQRVKRVHVPVGKDMTDFLMATNMSTVSRWIQEVAS